MFTKEEYRSEIDASAAKAAESQSTYDAATRAEAAAVHAKGVAFERWQHDLKLLDASVRLYVKALVSSEDKT